LERALGPNAKSKDLRWPRRAAQHSARSDIRVREDGRHQRPCRGSIGTSDAPYVLEPSPRAAQEGALRLAEADDDRRRHRQRQPTRRSKTSESDPELLRQRHRKLKTARFLRGSAHVRMEALKSYTINGAYRRSRKANRGFR